MADKPKAPSTVAKEVRALIELADECYQAGDKVTHRRVIDARCAIEWACGDASERPSTFYRRLAVFDGP